MCGGLHSTNDHRDGRAGELVEAQLGREVGGEQQRRGVEEKTLHPPRRRADLHLSQEIGRREQVSDRLVCLQSQSWLVQECPNMSLRDRV